MAIEDYSTTAADNTAVNGQAVSDSTAVDSVDNVIREVMADMADMYQNKIYPVGSLYISTLSTNPGTLLGIGTWAAFGAGRAVVGVGLSGTADNYNWSLEQERGLETHALATGELAAHTHGAGSLVTSSNNSHNHSIPGQLLFGGGTGTGTTPNAVGGSGWTTGSVTGTEPAHSHTVTGTGGSAGSGTAHNNLQPSIAVYIWKRTA